MQDGIRGGTVDRFQGQDAPVCLVSMTASTAEETSRDMEFLFSLNRMRLREAKSETVEQMQLVNTLCALEFGNE